MKEINIPKGLKEMGSSFFGCDSLEEDPEEIFDRNQEELSE